MIDTHKLKKRELYLNKLIAFRDTEPVKVVTGIRRCGKSSLLKLMAAHLKDTGVAENQIIEMNFESFAFKDMSASEFYAYVEQRCVSVAQPQQFFSRSAVHDETLGRRQRKHLVSHR